MSLPDDMKEIQRKPPIQFPKSPDDFLILTGGYDFTDPKGRLVDVQVANVVPIKKRMVK